MRWLFPFLALGCATVPPPDAAAAALRDHCDQLRDPEAQAACLLAVDAAEHYCSQAPQ